MAQYILNLMSDEIVLGSKSYVSSKRAAQACGYAQDYVGQLARSGIIDAQRVGGLWYVSMESLEAYKRNAEAYTPQAPQVKKTSQEPDTIVSFDGKDYVSASRAAKLTGYNPDYVGQLARSGKILSRQVGNRWYIERGGLLTHKSQKDALLASVQAESVGLVIPEKKIELPVVATTEAQGPYLTYIREDDHLMPVLSKPERRIEEAPTETSAQVIPIRIERVLPAIAPVRKIVRHAQPPVRSSAKTMRRATKVVAALTVVIVVSYGLSSMKSQSIYAMFSPTSGGVSSGSAMTASAASALDRIAEFIENIVSPEILFLRSL